MALIISDLSKYIICIVMAIYTYECFAVFRYKHDGERNGIYLRQIICMFLIHFVGFAAICLETSEISYIIFYGFQQIILFATIALFRVLYREANRLIVNNMCLLLAVGFVILTRLSFDRALRQFFIATLSIAIGLFVPFLVKKLKLLKKLTWVYGAVGIFALGIVMTLGAVTNGSNITFTVAGVTFQPSEFVKILFVFFIASLLATSKDFVQVITATGAAAVHVLILVLSRDLGSALIFFVVYVVMVFVATRNYWYLLIGVLGGAGAAVIAAGIFSHVRTRVLAWQNPWEYIDGAGFQIAQSLFAIGTGRWFGLGLNQGNPSAIPFVEADFIFSAISEEMGNIFALCLILVCLSCFIMFMNIAMKIKDEFYRLIAVGLSVTYIFQVFLTIGGGTKFIPLTGVTLPLVSYGGSSVLTTIIMFCIIQGLYGIRTLEGMEDARKKETAED